MKLIRLIFKKAIGRVRTSLEQMLQLCDITKYTNLTSLSYLIKHFLSRKPDIIIRSRFKVNLMIFIFFLLNKCFFLSKDNAFT